MIVKFKSHLFFSLDSLGCFESATKYALLLGISAGSPLGYENDMIDTSAESKCSPRVFFCWYEGRILASR
jgi:hypothetical protein